MAPINNANPTLIVQANESCDWSVQLGNSGGGGTTCCAEIVKNDSDGKFSGKMTVQGIAVVQMKKDRVLVKIDLKMLMPSWIFYFSCCIHGSLGLLIQSGKFDHTKKHHQSLIVHLKKCTEANIILKKNEKEFKTTIVTLKKHVSELTKNVLRKQTTINNYINMREETKKELACAKFEQDAIKLKLDSYSISRYVLDHIIDVQKKKGDVKGIAYQACPLPVRHNYTKMPDDEDMPHFEPTVPLDLAEFIAGLGFTKGGCILKSKSIE
ncbi:hypothetical protein Hanom_Chr06g00500441 [Helianthus anomalus]